ncbi:MAG: S-layer homology domain-containing protein [Microthrixaceae bacterium]
MLGAARARVLSVLLLLGGVLVSPVAFGAGAAAGTGELGPCAAPAPHGFGDIPAGSYFEPAVSWMVSAGISSGTEPGLFSPGQTATRAQAAVFLWRVAGSPATEGAHGFGDVPEGAWFEDAVAWLAAKGITVGTAPGVFSPGWRVTRAQIGAFLWRGECVPPTAVAAGGDHSCAIRQDRTVACWGSNGDGQLGNGTTTSRSSPTPVEGLSGATAISGGEGHSCAIRQDRTVACWGSNELGQLGDGTTTDRFTPTQVDGLTNATAITASRDHSCALEQDGTAVCWGHNGNGQLGDGTTTDRFTPTQVDGLTNATAITAGGGYSCAVKQNGIAVCWGHNGYGRLGDGTATDRWSPTQVDGLTNATAITAGQMHGCALKVDGTAACWGNNYFGQLGDGTTTTQWSPTPVDGLTNATSIITAGRHHSCAFKGNGTIACWGQNNNGQVGDGTTTDRATPTPVGF